MGGGSHSVPPFLALKKSVPPLLKMVVFLPFFPPFSLHFFLLNGAPSILSQVCPRGRGCSGNVLVCGRPCWSVDSRACDVVSSPRSLPAHFLSSRYQQPSHPMRSHESDFLSTLRAKEISIKDHKANELELILESKQDSTMSFLVALLLLLLVGLVHDELEAMVLVERGTHASPPAADHALPPAAARSQTTDRLLV